MARIGVWIVTASILLVCLIVVRLFLAPVNVSFARDIVRARAEAVLPGWQIDFDDAVVGWDWRSVRPWVAIHDLTLIDRRDRLRANVPEVRLGLAFTSILTEVSFSTIQINNANVRVSNLGAFSDATDNSMLGSLFDETGMPRPQVLRPVTEAFNRFGARLLTIAPGLDRVVLQNASVDIDRGAGLPMAHLNLPSFRLAQEDDKLSLGAQIDARLGDLPAQIRLNGQAEPLIGEMTVGLSVSGITPASLAAQGKLPEIVSALQFPVGLTLELELGSDVGLRNARFALDVDDGVLSHPVHYPKPAQIRYGTVRGDYDVAEQVLAIRQIELSTGAQTITGDGLVYWEEGDSRPGVRLFLTADEAMVADVLNYWPVQVYEDGTPRGARAWVDQHMVGGIADNARFQVDIRPDGSGAFEDGSPLKLTFNFRDIRTHYLLTMPPIEGATGQATLTEDSFRLGLTGGSILGMPVMGSTADLENINIKGGSVGTFAVQLAGDVPTAMKLIAYPPLELPQKMGFNTERLGGKANIRAVITLPLIKDVPKDDVHYSVTALLTETTVADLLGGEGLTEGDLTLAVDPDLLTVEGKGKLNGIPLDLRWREDTAAGRTDPDADTSQIVLSGRMDQEDLKAVGVDIGDFLNGKVLGEATFVGRSLQFRTGYFSADTLGAIVSVPQLAWQKRANEPANVTGTLVFDDTGTHLKPLVVNGETVDVTADFHWGPRESGLFSGNFDLKKLGRTESLSGTIDQRPGRPLMVDLWAAQLDLAPLLTGKKEPESDAGESNEGFVLNLKAGRVLLENGEMIKDAQVNLAFADGAPIMAEISGVFPHDKDDRHLAIKLSNTGEAPRPIHIETADSGALLRGFGLFAHLQGGSLTLDGTTSGWGGDLALGGRGTIAGALLVAKSSLAPDVTEGVISGLDSYLASGPVDLSSIDIPFTYDRGLLDLNGLKANGPSLGMTMEGQIEANNGRINVNGVIVPAYGLNSLLGKIPLVGGLFSGGEGKGLFGVSYRIKGMTEAPEVSVNALSGLAPGFLRLLFEGRKGKVSDVETPPAGDKPAETEPKETPVPEPQVDTGTGPSF